MMIRFLFVSAAVIFAGAAFCQGGTAKKPDGYSVQVKLQPYKNCWMYLGTYYAKNKILSDSAWLNDKGEGVFKGDKKLPQGIYFFVTPSHVLLFEILMDEMQHFSVTADSAHLENLTTEGSEDNAIFAGYSRFLSLIGPQLNALQSQLKAAKTKADSAAIQQQLSAKNKELNDFRDQLVKDHPGSMVADFFSAVKIPELKEWPKKADGKVDSLAAWRYMKEHFWDGVSFYDDKLVRTPFIDAKLDDYYKYYVPQEPDSVIAEVNYMMLVSRTAPEMHRYLLGRFTDKYISPEVMGQDKVFLFLFNNYFSKGDTLWLNDKQKKFIFDRAYSLMANQLDEPAQELMLTDTAGRTVSLYKIKSPFTFVVFWDPTCGHCKIEVPQLDSMYRAKWQKEGVTIYSVNVNEKTFPEWKQFIKEHKLDGWFHVWQTKEAREADEKAGRANFRQLYDVFQTPTMYLLDENKNIIAKKLSLEQYDSIIDKKLKLKQSKSTNN